MYNIVKTLNLTCININMYLVSVINYLLNNSYDYFKASLSLRFTH